MSHLIGPPGRAVGSQGVMTPFRGLTAGWTQVPGPLMGGNEWVPGPGALFCFILLQLRETVYPHSASALTTLSSGSGVGGEEMLTET